MQPYIINSFRRNRGGAIFQRVPANSPNAGMYQNVANNEERFHAAQFVCNGNFAVHSITRQTRTAGRQLEQETFTVGDVLMGNGNSPITSFTLIDSDLVAVNSEGRTGTPLAEAAIYRTHDGRVIGAATVPLPNVPQQVTPVTATQPAANVTPLNLADLEAHIIANYPRTIRMERLMRRRTESLQAFLIRFFEQWNRDRNTIYVDNETVQTDTGRRRSLGDIFMICRYYYPNCTLLEVMRLLYITLPAHFGPRGGFRTCVCSTIHKRVWYHGEEQREETAALNLTTRDEYGFLYPQVKTHIEAA